MKKISKLQNMVNAYSSEKIEATSIRYSEL
jgi:hypothetical protein